MGPPLGASWGGSPCSLQTVISGHTASADNKTVIVTTASGRREGVPVSQVRSPPAQNGPRSLLKTGHINGDVPSGGRTLHCAHPLTVPQACLRSFAPAVTSADALSSWLLLRPPFLLFQGQLLVSLPEPPMNSQSAPGRLPAPRGPPAWPRRPRGGVHSTLGHPPTFSLPRLSPEVSFSSTLG